MAAWIDATEPLHTFLARPGHLLGVDTEFMRTDTFHPKLALLQIELDGEMGLVDPLAPLESSELAARLADPQTISVMHSASEDLDALVGLVPAGLGQLFDTQIAAAFAGLGAGLGYQKLVATLLDIDLPKGETRSDWLRRPLSPQQLEYAAQDVLHLPILHEQLTARMQQRGYAAWHAEDCARMLERARHREPDPQPQVSFRGAAEWPLETQALLRRVLLWRDLTARRIDKPRPWILDDARALDLAARVPATSEDLYERIRGLRALRSPERAELLELLHQPLQESELEFAPIPASPTTQERRAVTALKEVVSARAAELDLPEGLLCARRHLESLWISGTWPSALEGWRKPLLHDPLMERMQERKQD